MGAEKPFAVQAVSDGDDRLLAADEPLAGLQLRAGGTIPGAIAIPELRNLVTRARQLALKLARPITAYDEAENIRVWVEVAPLDPTDQGCAITLRHWQAEPRAAEHPDHSSRLRTEIDRELAEFSARLDARQALLAVENAAPDLVEAATAMRGGLGRPWTDFVTIAGDNHHQPLHWRLLDGASVRLAGSNRVWRATLVPQTLGNAEPAGFELCLTALVPLAAPAEPLAAQSASAGPSLIGNELAPVLRQPIARIVATAVTIRTRRAGPLADEYASYAGDISSAGQHLLGLVEDLADIEVIESRTFHTAADQIDLADVARRAAGILGMRARERGITIAAPPPEMSLPAVAEFRRVLQILLNLIGNAIRYTPENSNISVELTELEGRVQVAVADEGAGLALEDQARVFDKFERLGRSGDGGSGLGLYISRRLARAMGGELSVDSTKGKGARFVLELPGGAGGADSPAA